MAETVLHAGHGAPRYIDWRAGVYAGLIAGVVFLILEMGMVWLFMGESPWAPPRMIAAIVLGEGVLPMPPDKPATFSLGIVMTAMIIHFVLSIIYGLIGAAIVANRMGYAAAIGLGALGGSSSTSSTSTQSPRRCSPGLPWRGTGSASSPTSCSE
jgi:hypothetical protein